MAQRRPITTHPAFVPAVVLWFAALFGLVVAVLPLRLLALAGLGDGAGRIALSLAAGGLGAALGWAVARMIVPRAAADPRPVYDEPDIPFVAPVRDEPVRRPLRVREELDAGLEVDGPDSDLAAGEWHGPAATRFGGADAAGDDSWMILTPQPVHPAPPAPPAPDLETLLAQFDNAIAAFRHDDVPPASPPPPHRFDPVRAFVARQTGGAAASPLGGAMPDHQAELRSALDKLARARSDD